jgi:electron transfer flavoprotein alpha subunit
VTGPEVAGLPAGLDALALVLARAGELPAGAAEAVTEAGGAVLVTGDGAEQAAAAAGRSVAGRAWFCETGAGLQPGWLAARLAPVLAAVPLIVLPATADGRDLAPRLAARLGRPLLAGACQASLAGDGPGVAAQLCRLDDRVVLPVRVPGPAVVTLAPGTGIIGPPPARPAVPVRLSLPGPAGRGGSAGETGLAPGGSEDEVADQPWGADPRVLAVACPEAAAVDLAEAALVFGGGAGLAAGLDAGAARAVFDLLIRVAAAAGAAAGATRVATDAGWADSDRQIGTTGVMIAPRRYVAFGVSGAVQHTGGLGEPEQVASVNTDPHCPMTAMSSLGIIADARGTLVALARELGVEVPEEVTTDAG